MLFDEVGGRRSSLDRYLALSSFGLEQKPKVLCCCAKRAKEGPGQPLFLRRKLKKKVKVSVGDRRWRRRLSKGEATLELVIQTYEIMSLIEWTRRLRMEEKSKVRRIPAIALLSCSEGRHDATNPQSRRGKSADGSDAGGTQGARTKSIE
jgi:hypothetical protein